MKKSSKFYIGQKVKYINHIATVKNIKYNVFSQTYNYYIQYVVDKQNYGLTGVEENLITNI